MTNDLYHTCQLIHTYIFQLTLEKHHPWLVQKAAYLAMHMLPTKDALLVRVCGDDPEEKTKAVSVFHQAINAMKTVYEQSNKIYKDNNVLDLP